MTFVSDQTQVKLLAEQTVSYEPLETFRTAKANGGSKPEAAEGADDAADESGDSPAKGGGALDAAKSLLSSLTGGKKGSKPAEPDDEKPAEPAPPLNLVDPRGPMNQIPAHPAGKTGPAVEKAKEDAVKAAKGEMIRAVFGVKPDPSGTLAELLSIEPNADTLELPSLQIVGMKWLDQKRLEVEVQVLAADVVHAIKLKFPDDDLPLDAAFDPNKAVEAKGVGELKDESAGDRALPGERARRASEGAPGF
jgi:hypothetical protein